MPKPPPFPGHKFAGAKLSIHVSCECGWSSGNWGAAGGGRSSAYAEWRSHVDEHRREAETGLARGGLPLRVLVLIPEDVDYLAGACERYRNDKHASRILARKYTAYVESVKWRSKPWSLTDKDRKAMRAFADGEPWPADQVMECAP